MKHEPISGSTATRLELAPVHSGSDAIRRHAEEGRYVLDRIDLAVTEGASHQRLSPADVDAERSSRELLPWHRL